MSENNELELIEVCHGVTEVNPMTASGFCSMISTIETLDRLEHPNELITSLRVWK